MFNPVAGIGPNWPPRRQGDLRVDSDASYTYRNLGPDASYDYNDATSGGGRRQLGNWKPKLRIADKSKMRPSDTGRKLRLPY